MMIERLTGTVVRILPSGAILDVNGVGYGVELPLSQLCLVPEPGQQLSLWTYTHVREDAIRLFGFLGHEERATFELLLSLGGVGPKLALAILSTLDLSDIRSAILRDDPILLERVPGVGKRMAEKILVELKPKLKHLGAIQSRSEATSLQRTLGVSPERLDDESQQIFDDLKSALENLGFKEKTLIPVMDRLRNDDVLPSFPILMRKALIELRGARAED